MLKSCRLTGLLMCSWFPSLSFPRSLPTSRTPWHSSLKHFLQNSNKLSIRPLCYLHKGYPNFHTCRVSIFWRPFLKQWVVFLEDVLLIPLLAPPNTPPIWDFLKTHIPLLKLACFHTELRSVVGYTSSSLWNHLTQDCVPLNQWRLFTASAHFISVPVFSLVPTSRRMSSALPCTRHRLIFGRWRRSTTALCGSWGSHWPALPLALRPTDFSAQAPILLAHCVSQDLPSREDYSRFSQEVCVIFLHCQFTLAAVLSLQLYSPPK